MERYCLTLDLKDDPELIEEYKAHHRKVWPEILASILQAGIHKMDIYLVANRLCMLLEVDEAFSFAAKAKADKENPRVQEWETLMWRYQQHLPFAAAGEKWTLMDNIFSLTQS